MKRILTIVTTSMVPYGGLASVALNYYRQLDKNKFQMDFASNNVICKELNDEFSNSGARYFNLGKRNTVHIVKYFFKLVSLCGKYDIVHIHANSATATVELLAAFFAGVPQRIIHIHNSKCTYIKIHTILKPLFDRLYSNAIACSRVAGDWCFKDCEYLILNNAVDINQYKYSENNRIYIRNKYCISDEIVIGHVGKMVEQKNHKFILKVFERILKLEPRAKLMLVGDGEKKKALKQITIDLSISSSIIFCGMQNDSSKYYSAFDVFLFPSLWEGLPLSLVEAQANGLKCIVSDCITSEVDKGGIQSLSLSEDIDIWAEMTLKDICINNRESNSLNYCKKISEDGFDVSENVKKLEEVYLKNDRR